MTRAKFTISSLNRQQSVHLNLAYVWSYPDVQAGDALAMMYLCCLNEKEGHRY